VVSIHSNAQLSRGGGCAFFLMVHDVHDGHLSRILTETKKPRTQAEPSGSARGRGLGEVEGLGEDYLP
jgi:hypothetical protein